MAPDQSEDEFRAEAAAWLAEHAPAMRERLDAAADAREHFEAGRYWQRTLCDNGWAGITWPVEYGGRGGTARHAAIFAEEQARYSVSASGKAGMVSGK